MLDNFACFLLSATNLKKQNKKKTGIVTIRMSSSLDPDKMGNCLTVFLLAATCRLLITFANSFDPDQDCLDLDPNRLMH